MTQRNLEIYVDGRPLTSIAPWGDPVIEHRWPGGTWEIRWSQPLKPWKRPKQLQVRKLVEARVGSAVVGAAQLADLDFDGGEFAAVGAVRQGEETLCFDGTGQLTTIINTAIDQGIARGQITGTRPASISAAAFGSSTTTLPNYVTALLDAYFKEQVGTRYYVDNSRAWRSAADPTAPTAMVRPDAAMLAPSGTADVATVYGRYLNSATGQYATAFYPSPAVQGPELGVSFVERGPITTADATSRCQAVWTELRGKSGWARPVTVHSGDLRSLGGGYRALWTFQAGPAAMLRIAGARDDKALLMNTDFVVGRTIWREADDTLQIDPIGKTVRSDTDIIEAQGGVLLS